MTASSAGESTVLLGFEGPMGASVVVVRERHLGERGTAQAIPLGQGAGLFFRRLGLGSNSRRSSGAAVKHCCHNVFFSSVDRITSRLSGTVHLVPSGCAPGSP